MPINSIFLAITSTHTSAFSIKIIITENRIGDMNSNPGLDCLLFISFEWS